MLQNCAQWIAEEAKAFNIPLRKLSSSEAQSGAAGVCGHVDLGASGGGHWDPGPSFPWAQVMAMATGGDVPTPSKKGKEMIAATSTGKGYWTTTTDGAIYAFGDAQHRGQPFPNTKVQPIIGIAGCGNNGYWLLAQDGGVFAYGSAQFYGRPDRT